MEYTVIGRPLATHMVGGLLIVHTEKGVFWWDEPDWRKLERPPANEVLPGTVVDEPLSDDQEGERGEA